MQHNENDIRCLLIYQKKSLVQIIAILIGISSFLGEEQTFGCQVVSLESEDGLMKKKPGKMTWRLGDNVVQESIYYEEVN